MMDCAQYRRALLADPKASSPELAEHVAGCPECSAYRQRLLGFEGRLAQALRIDTGSAARTDRRMTRETGRTTPIGRSTAPRPRRIIPIGRFRRIVGIDRLPAGRLAMAASILGALILAGGLWIATPRPTLAADVVAHMAEEPEAWTRTLPVPTNDLTAVLAGAHMTLRSDAGQVSYAQTCPFRGHRVPHLVVRTDRGPVTVMVLVHESVAKPQPFDEAGYRGVIVPMPGHGSLAVLARDRDGNMQAVERVAARVRAAIVWTG